jgi:hypothetical protein
MRQERVSRIAVLPGGREVRLGTKSAGFPRILCVQRFYGRHLGVVEYLFDRVFYANGDGEVKALYR